MATTGWLDVADQVPVDQSAPSWRGWAPDGWMNYITYDCGFKRDLVLLCAAGSATGYYGAL